MNSLLKAAEKGSRAERWHPQPILKAALQRLDRIARDHFHLLPAQSLIHLQKAQEILHGGRSMFELEEAAAELVRATAACRRAGQRAAATEIRLLRADMADARIHMRDRARPHRIAESAGFCARCWRITDNFRGDKYLCELHAGGSKIATAKAAARLMKSKDEAILSTEAQLLAELGFLFIRREEDWIKRPALPDALTVYFAGEDQQEVTGYRPQKFSTSVVPDVLRRRQKDERAAVYTACAKPSGRYVDFSLAFARAGTDLPVRAAMYLARDGLAPPRAEARSVNTALLRIAADHYYVARVLSRAEAFLRFTPERRI